MGHVSSSSEKAANGARRDSPGIEQRGHGGSERGRLCKASGESRRHEWHPEEESSPASSKRDAGGRLDQDLARIGMEFPPVHSGAVVADQLSIQPHRCSGLDPGQVGGQAVEDRYRGGRAAGGRDRSGRSGSPIP